jgi:DNA primase
MIKTESIESLKQIIDIVDVVGNYVELKKYGSNFKACCPFHAEKTPSFVVSSTKGIFHCFGCHASGDAIKFVQDYEKIGYAEAIEKLADMFNFKLEYTTAQTKKTDILERFNDFFKKNLENNKTAREYILKRGVYESQIERFELGYAPSSSEQIAFLKSSFLSSVDAVETGIFGEEGGRIFARQVERITFPIKNQNGKIIGFGGRTITNHPAKYINSPQTRLFNKSKVFYGINLAKEQIFKTRELIVCEGYMDVIMLHQAGFTNAVAVLGTALTKEHLPFIKKAEAKAVLAFDTDGAGLNAAYKSAKLLTESSIEGGVAVFDKGFDPADMIKEGKTNELAHIFRKSKPFMEFLFESIVKKYDMSSQNDKERAANEAKEILAASNKIFLEENRRLASALLNVPISTFKIKKDGDRERLNISKYDPAEASAIKSMLQNHTLLDMAANRIGSEMFEAHRDLYELLAAGDFDSARLLEIEQNEQIKAMSGEDLHSFLVAKSLIFYDKILFKIKTSKDIETTEKSFFIQKVMAAKERLKKGELSEIDDSIVSLFG